MLMQRCASSVAEGLEEARLCGLGSVDDGAPVLEDDPMQAALTSRLYGDLPLGTSDQQAQ
jgi:hypothetical protein